MALKSKKVVIYFLEDGQISIRPTDGKGKRFKTLEGKIYPPSAFKNNPEELGKEVLKIKKQCI